MTQKFNRSAAKKRVLQKRKQMDLTQEELAYQVGMSTQSYSMAERTSVKVFFTPEQLIGLKYALKVSIDYILEGVDSNPIVDQEKEVLLNKIAEQDQNTKILNHQLKMANDLIDALKGQVELLKKDKQ